jgi:hypothetical protein
MKIRAIWLRVIALMMILIVVQSGYGKGRIRSADFMPLPYSALGGTPAVHNNGSQSNAFTSSETHSQFAVNLEQDSTTFTPVDVPFLGSHAGDALWCDYDNDGDLDMILSGWSDSLGWYTKIYRNDNGTFVDMQADIAQLGTHHGVAWGDFDNDGYYDVAIEGRLDTLGYSPVTKIYRNDNGTFVDINAPVMQLNGGSVTWVDYDNDGDLDLFICGSPDYGASVYSKLYRNDNGQFTEVQNTGIMGLWSSSASWGDYNNDGFPDLLITGYDGSYPHSIIYRNNNGNGTFTDIGASFPGVVSGTSTWVDFNNDGWPDVAIQGCGWGHVPITELYKNTGNGVFANINANIYALMHGSISFADYDNDGYLDFALAGSRGWLGDSMAAKIYRNNHDETFSDIGAVLTGTYYASATWGDYDNDGRLDLVLTGATAADPPSVDGPYNPVTILYKNNVLTGNSTPASPQGLSANISGRNIHLGWVSASDQNTPKGGLSYNVRIGTSPGGINILAPSSIPATGYRRMVKSGNAGFRRGMDLKNLPDGKYYWSVQTIDNEMAGSSFSDEQNFTVGRDSTHDVTFKITVFESDSEKTDLEFGVRAGATDSLDSEYEVELPPFVPFPGHYNACWVLGGRDKAPSLNNFQDTVGGARIRNIYTLEVQKDRLSDSIVFRWNNDTIPYGTLYFRDEATDGLIYNVDMSLVDSLVVRRTQISWFQVVYYGDSFTLEVPVAGKWNMLSLGLSVANPEAQSLFSSAQSHPFAFDETKGYCEKDSISMGIGYWMKFDSAEYVALRGLPRSVDTVYVHQGWNLIGSISWPVHVSSILQDPSNIIASNFFGYNRGYQTTDLILPVKGYWVNVSAPGKLILAHGSLATSEEKRALQSISSGGYNSLLVKDAAGNSTNLYFGVNSKTQSACDVLYSVLPPLPPKGGFDARFNADQGLALFGDESKTVSSYPLSIQATAYPVDLSWNIVQNNSSGYCLVDESTGNILVPNLSYEKHVLISSSKVKLALRQTNSSRSEIPATYSLEQNYPNPFNPTTNIQFSLPKATHVTLKVFNLLGQEVATLVSCEVAAGWHVQELNAANLSSGMYFYRLQAGTYSETKKLVLMK